MWIDYGKGSRIWDVDGFEYSDFHGGFGVGVAGHAHPAIVEAVQDRVTKGTHFAQPTEDAIVVARELSARYGLPQWRYNNSGTESTMDAFHLMRVATGRNKVLKVEGSYHGHHDSAQVSVYPTPEEAGSVEAAELRGWLRHSRPDGAAHRCRAVRVTSPLSSGRWRRTRATSRA